ncbi:biopolymer transporter ExbD [Rhodobacteraceae bacterium RKSG542]|uniref:ExbD/TolR family protein n=1 Tax=Pseudovibrio flavus TaxID=2529854 RepID=UPI0012BD117C|nr:biopolymer transporter ExbD [Pseudovibrio flavus]MTI17122.1 biopolymer transporter ExbD [Pseudovibrio flavus]
MKFQRRSNKNQIDSTIALINIVFLMLVFFMVAGTIETTSLRDIALPESPATREKQALENALLIKDSGDIFKGKQLYNEHTVPLETQDDLPIYLVVDKALSGVRLTEILQVLKERGAEEIKLLVQRRAS